MPFELRPEPNPTLRPEEPYLQNAWRASVYPLAARLGIPIQLPTISPQPHTRLAHEGLEFAKEHGRAAAYNSAVLEGFFRRDLDIGNIDVLAALAAESGLDPSAFRHALESGQYTAQHQKLLRHAYEEVGVSGVPLFLIGSIRLTGIQDVRTLTAAIHDQRIGGGPDEGWHPSTNG